jgi:hypothetical protein
MNVTFQVNWKYSRLCTNIDINPAVKINPLYTLKSQSPEPEPAIEHRIGSHRHHARQRRDHDGLSALDCSLQWLHSRVRPKYDEQSELSGTVH